MKRSVFYGLVFLLIFLVTASIGGMAQKEEAGVIKYYTDNDEAELDIFASAISKGTGLKLEPLRMSSGEAWARVTAEAPNIGADMHFGWPLEFALMAKEKGLLMKYISGGWKEIPAQYKDPEGYWYGWSYWFACIGVNTKLLQEKGYPMPKSWKDLLDPRWKGEIVMPNPGTSGTAFLAVSTIMQLYGEEEGWRYLEKLHQNVDQYTKSGSAPGQLVAQGEYIIGITWDQAVETRKNEGYPIEVVIPEEGTGYALDIAIIYKNTSNPSSAKKFIDYIGSKEFHEAVSKSRSKVTYPGVESLVKFNPKLIDYNARWAAENRDRIMGEWKSRFGQ
ncbi:MAG: ABC transporter substrate-binding protein [Spirochaetota bacterium]